MTILRRRSARQQRAPHEAPTTRPWLRSISAALATAIVATGPGFVEAGTTRDRPSDDASTAATWGGTPTGPAPARQQTSLNVQTVMTGLDHPWDVAFTPAGAMLVTQRNRGTILIRRQNGNVDTLVSNVPGLWVSGETGLMGIVVDPRFRNNRRFYTCHGHQAGGQRDVRVVAWRANQNLTSARQVRVLVKGIHATSGRHGGCRLRFGRERALFVGTGDAATSGVSRNRRSLAGKVLRVGPGTGRALPGNPFINSPFPRARKIWTYGHRNVQGLALRPGGRMWSVEHGPDRDDEVNVLFPGGDYGWDPGPGYDESVPMTDHSLPGTQIDARWSSGFPTTAPSGATWLAHPRWAGRRGMLAVANLRDRSLLLMRFDRQGRLVRVGKPAALNGTHGRLRAAQLGPDGRLYLTTDNGGGNDRVLAVAPAG